MKILRHFEDLLLLMYDPDDVLFILSTIYKPNISRMQRYSRLLQEVRIGLQSIMLDREALQRENQNLKDILNSE